MRRKNIKIRQFVSGGKVNSVFVGRRLNDYFVTGDADNNVVLYTFSGDQPLITFTTNTNANVHSEVSAVGLTWEDNLIFSASNRGIINIWDIGSAKTTPSSTLKGHATSVNCFGIFPDNDERLASGSYDTHIKLWDIKNKNNTGILKHHTKQINSIDISPDGRYLISGSQDATSKLWDLRYPEKLVATYSEHTAPVTKVKFNPEDCMFASCSMDRTAKYFRSEYNHYNYVSTTELVSMPITAIQFSPDGRNLCTAGNDILKIWNMNKNGLLMETIDSAWRGVQEIVWTDKGLLGVASSNQNLSIWYCDIEKKLKKNQNTAMRVDNQSKLPRIFRNYGERMMESSLSKQKSYEKIKQSRGTPKVDNKNLLKDLDDVKKNVDYVLDIVNDLDEKNLKQKEKLKQIQKAEQQKREIELEQERRMEQQKLQKIKAQKEKRKRQKEQRQNEMRQKLKREQQQQQKRKLEQLQRQRIERQKALQEKLQTTFEENQEEQLNATLQNSSIMNISAFMGDGVQKERLRQIEVIGDIMKDSGKYASIVTTRTNAIRPIMHLWKNGNIEAALRALSQYSPKQKDASVVSDCISGIIHSSRFKSSITPDAACLLVEKLIQLMQNKHSTYVKTAMHCSNEIVVMFKDELIKVKMFNPMTRVDLAREERLAKYDRLTESFLNLFKQERVRKYSSEGAGKEELHRITRELYQNLEEVLRKIMPKNQPECA